MASYLAWSHKKISAFDSSEIEELYDKGFVFTRLGKGELQQTRSVRIILSEFELTSENRRILKKVEDLSLESHSIPFSNYSWEIGKTAKDFYEARGATFSANKIKELLTNSEKSNFTTLLLYRDTTGVAIGYVIVYESENIFHYSYPFYTSDTKDVGLGMILKALLWAKEHNKKLFYLGSLQRPSDTYKLQFKGISWYNGDQWANDIVEAKQILSEQHNGK